jgi:choline dehydrogenase-like flavoprotein
MHYAANYWRFRPIDFNEFSLKGGVPGAAMADWPITYDELEPYYTAVEWAIGVSGQGGVDPDEGRRSRQYPLPPLDITGPGVLLEVAAKKLGWRALPAPMAIASRPYKGREGCHNCGFCWNFPCEWGAKSGTNFTMVPEALASGRCELRTECKVSMVETDDRGRVTGVVYFDRDRREVRQRARAVFLCARRRDAAAAVHVEVQPFSRRPGEQQRYGRETPHVQRQHGGRRRVRARGERVQGRPGVAHCARHV